MKQCQFCAEDIQDAAIVCKHCGRDQHSVAPAPDEPRRGYGWIIALFLIVVAIAIAGRDTSTPTPASAITEMPPLASRALQLFGPPDSDTSSDTEIPRPLIITRILTYRTKGVRLIYVPQQKTPPYGDWVFVGAVDTTREQKLEPLEAAYRLVR